MKKAAAVLITLMMVLALAVPALANVETETYMGQVFTYQRPAGWDTWYEVQEKQLDENRTEWTYTLSLDEGKTTFFQVNEVKEPLTEIQFDKTAGVIMSQMKNMAGDIELSCEKTETNSNPVWLYRIEIGDMDVYGAILVGENGTLNLTYRNENETDEEQMADVRTFAGVEE